MQGFLFVAVMLGLGGCTLTPPVIQSGADPSDPKALIPAASKISELTAGGAMAPVSPLPWNDVNRRVSPGKRPAQ